MMRQLVRERPKPRVNISGAFIRRSGLEGADLSHAVLSEADAANSSFRGADFENTNLRGTKLQGADLRDARNLTEEQIRSAVIDERTRLPDHLAHLSPGNS